MNSKPFLSLFAASGAALLAGGCNLDSVHDYDCKSPDGTSRSASIESRLATSYLTTKTTEADGTVTEKTHSLSRYRGTGLAQIKEQADRFCNEGTEPPGYTR